jgi:PAS domain S-box-containing protein
MGSSKANDGNGMELEQAKRLYQSNPTLHQISEFILAAALYFTLAKASLAFASVNPSASPIWPPTGLAVALVLLRGYRALPAIAVGAFAANLSTTGIISSSLLIAVGNTLEAGVAVYLLNRWAQGRDAFVSPSGIVKFAGCMVAIATPISATIGLLALALVGHANAANALNIWGTWWLGNIAGAIIVTPVITLWSTRPTHEGVQANRETLLTFLAAAIIGALAFSPLLSGIISRNAIAFLVVLPLLWAALRQSPRDTATVALILSAFAIWGVTIGDSPFIQPTLNESLLLLVAFIASATLPSLALSAAVTSRESALRKHEESYHLLVDSVRDYAIIMLDTEGRVVSWNSGAKRIKGYSEQEILGHHFREFYQPDDQERGEPERALAAAKQSGRWESEGWRVRRDGSKFWASAVLSAVRSRNGKLLGFAKVTRDMTERRNAELALERTRDELLQSQKLEAIGQLTGGIAHDFNNLLMAISAGVRMISQPDHSEQRPEIVEALKQAVERGTDLTKQLLTFARRGSLNPETIDPADCIHGMRSLLNRSLREDIIVEINCEPDLWSIKVDRGQLELAILNLAVNARDAMPKGGLLNISATNVASKKVDQVRISVTDTGGGMIPEVQARAFEPFYTTKDTGRGTGLGLSQVYGFAKQSGGLAHITSQVGRGTTVSLLLPRTQDTKRVPTQVEPSTLVIGSGNILVVEDDDNVAAIVTHLIEQLGYQPTRASNGVEALKLLDQGKRFDIIFSDIIMSGSTNGIELAHKIRLRFPDMPILLTTGYPGTSSPSNVPFPVLRKPYEIHELGMAISKAIRDPPGATNR